MLKTLNPSLRHFTGRAGRIAAILDEFKGEDIAVLDLRAVADFADAFVIATARSTTHMQALVGNLDTKLREEGLHAIGPVEKPGPRSEARWVVLDYADVVVHIFTQEARNYYDLEGLWGDAAPIDWQNQRLQA